MLRAKSRNLFVCARRVRCFAVEAWRFVPARVSWEECSREIDVGGESAVTLARERSVDAVCVHTRDTGKDGLDGHLQDGITSSTRVPLSVAERRWLRHSHGASNLCANDALLAPGHDKTLHSYRSYKTRGQ